MNTINEEEQIPPEIKKHLDQISMTIYGELIRLATESGFEIEISEEWKFCTWLSREMKRRDISLVKLSKKTRIPKSTLHGWMVGRGNATFERLRVILKALE